jgi:hypothetical protein
MEPMLSQRGAVLKGYPPASDGANRRVLTVIALGGHGSPYFWLPFEKIVS